MSFSKADIDNAARLADTTMLDDYDGRSVVRVNVAVTGAGDGLSAALAVTPRQFHLGEDVVLVMTGKVTKLGYVEVDPGREDSALALVPTIKASGTTIAAPALAAKLVKDVAKQEELIRRGVEAARGINPLANDGVSVLPDLDDDDDEPAPLPGDDDEPAPL